jgi:DNA-binding transcriptional regulator/RsmH inhibitor MraZ
MESGESSFKIGLTEKKKKLKEKIIFAGLYSRVEIWDEKSWEKKQTEVSGRADEVASKLQEIGMI